MDRFNQGNFGGGWREGGGDRGASEQELEQRHSQQNGNQNQGYNGQAQQFVDPNDALLYGAMQDPMLKQQIADDIRNRVMGQQGGQQQQQLDPVQQLEKEIADLEQQLAVLNAAPDDQNKQWNKIYELDSLRRDKRVDLVDKRNEIRYSQQQQNVNNQQVQQYFAAFLQSTVGRMPLSPEQKHKISEDFIMHLRTQWAQDVLGNPQQIQQVVPETWKSFAYDRNLPRPDAQGQYGNQAPRVNARQGEQYNGMQAPPEQPADPNDPLARIGEMNDYERAMMKARYYEAGQYDLAAKIMKKDGTPFKDNRSDY